MSKQLTFKATVVKTTQSNEGPWTIVFESRPDEEPRVVTLTGRELGGFQTGTTVVMTIVSGTYV